MAESGKTSDLLELIGQSIQALVRQEVAIVIAASADSPTLEGLRAQLRNISDQPRVGQARTKYTQSGKVTKTHLTPASRRILATIKKEPKSVMELVDLTQLRRKTVENNLGMLRAAGLLRTVEA